MVVLITGATGSVGRALARVLRRDGHQVIAAVRSVGRARDGLGHEVRLVDISDERALSEAIERADAVVNLAGEGIAERRWTARRKQALIESRVALTRRLSDLIARARNPPPVLVSASAIGIYPDRGDTPQDEQAQPATGFLGSLSADWEDAALRSKSERTRVVCLRIGVVLDAEGGALAKILPIFRLGLGGRLGSGRQYFSFIHLDDLLGIILFALRTDSLHGALNATAPEPVQNRELTQVLARLLGRPAIFPVPAFALRLVMGARAELMLASQRVVPRALERAGYRFLFPTIADALGEIVGRLRESTRIAPRAFGAIDGEPSNATHVLTQVTELAAPLAEVFPFFSRAQNLGWITPAWMGFHILGTPPEDISADTIIEYDIKVGPLPLRWRTRIAVFEPGLRFVDNQERGPYSVWWHEHSFEEHAGGTRMIDRVLFRVPLGALGNLVAGIVVRSMLSRIFAYRAQAMAQRFGRSRADVEAREAAQ